jgi:hypothetical protein
MSFRPRLADVPFLALHVAPPSIDIEYPKRAAVAGPEDG